MNVRMSILVFLTAFATFGSLGCGQNSASPGNVSQANTDGAAGARVTPSKGVKEGEPSPPRSYAPLSRVPVTHSGLGTLPGCGPQEVVGLMTHFVAAFNEGDESTLKRLFPRRATLTPWLFSVNRGSKAEVSTDNLADLGAYFAERHTKNDRLELVSVEVRPSNASSGETVYADVTYTMNRRADDLGAAPGSAIRTIGKSVVDCRRQVLVLTSLETRP